MEKITLFGLLEKYSVLIPALQRNYVHGRDEPHADVVRKNFVDSVCKCICAEKDTMDLGVVYGIGGTCGLLIPIDGQQRLTTLWLVSVFAVSKYVFDNDERRKKLSLLSRFSYESRPLASAFCWWLTSANYYSATNDIVSSLAEAEQRWGMDPTVDAMIRTLRLIDDSFRNSTSEEKQHICDVVLGDSIMFSFSEVTGDATDLYIKINARGKTLTQWENFKGQFSASLKDDNKASFDKQIEQLSDKYYDAYGQYREFEWQKLPDNAFFLLWARVTDYVLRTDTALKGEGKVGENLSRLAEAKAEETLTYVPVDEFRLDKTAKEVSGALLNMIGWCLENPDCRLWYWEDEGSIVDALFYPKSADERDFALFLFEYFNKYKDGKGGGLRANGYRAMRLVANILSGDNVARNPKDGKDPASQFNRIAHLKSFVGNAELYSSDIELGQDQPDQLFEERAKAELYTISGFVEPLQKCERLMCGRIRLAMFDLEAANDVKIYDKSPNCDKFRSRAQRIVDLLTQWRKGVKNERKQLLRELVLAEAWDIPYGRIVPISLEDDTYRRILRSGQAGWLQHSLIDQTEDPQRWYDREKGNWGVGVYARDWRISVADFVSKDGVFGAVAIDKNNGLHIKWHGSSGAYYLYTLTNNPGAIPVGDYRVDFYFNEEMRRRFKDFKIQSMQINASGERIEEIPSSNFHLHFGVGECRVFVQDAEEHWQFSSVPLGNIEKMGWAKFLGRIWGLAQKQDSDLRSAITEDRLVDLLVKS